MAAEDHHQLDPRFCFRSGLGTEAAPEGSVSLRRNLHGSDEAGSGPGSGPSAAEERRLLVRQRMSRGSGSGPEETR